MVNAVLVLVVVLVPVAALLVSSYMVIQKFFHFQDQMDLHAPLLDSDDNNRMNNALREAKAMTHCCSLCAFENPLRNDYCCLCGTKLSRSKAPAERAGIKRWLLSTKEKAPEKEETEAPILQQLTSRQRRARNRKEWVRVLLQSVNEESSSDQLVWQRTRGADENATAGLDQGFVLKFHVPDRTDDDLSSDEEKEARSSLDEIVVDEGSQTVEQLASPPVEIAVEERDNCREENEQVSSPLDEIVIEEARGRIVNSNDPSQSTLALSPNKLRRCMDELKNTTVELIAVNDGSAASISFVDSGINSTSTERRTSREIADFTAVDFPSKYAFFVAATTSLLSENADEPRILLKTTRDEAYTQSMAILSQLPTQRLRSPLQIHFDGESGVDAGGLLREWTTVVAQGLVGRNQKNILENSSPTPSQVFAKIGAEDEAYHLCNGTDEPVEQAVSNAYAAGRFVGRALLGGNLLGFHLSLPLLKAIVSAPLTFSDLEFFDLENFRSLSWLLNNDDVATLGLDFTVSETVATVAGGTTSQKVATRDLVPGGANIEVTDANKVEFVSLKFRDIVFGRVKRMVYPFLKGVFEVVPADLLALFDPEELDYLISGSDEIDVADWIRNTKYSEELYGHNALRWFWELVEEMPTEYRRRLLQFATGSSRVPLGGFAALTSYDGRVSPFTLQGISYRSSGGNIRSHACFNRLDLPLYWERSRMKSVLYAVLSSDDNVGFTMQ